MSMGVVCMKVAVDVVDETEGLEPALHSIVIGAHRWCLTCMIPLGALGRKNNNDCLRRSDQHCHDSTQHQKDRTSLVYEVRTILNKTQDSTRKVIDQR